MRKESRLAGKWRVPGESSRVQNACELDCRGRRQSGTNGHLHLDRADLEHVGFAPGRRSALDQPPGFAVRCLTGERRDHHQRAEFPLAPTSSTELSRKTPL